MCCFFHFSGGGLCWDITERVGGKAILRDENRLAVECVDHYCSSASSPNSCWLEVIWLPL
ncbi:hypothetical protein EYF80_008359 [Liparis tanakae]|uniref:Uncharacterized protein n=1 Tax=Liparis tanakae TaxID=230148 RepID=A0A4Z2ITG9_9TELE|nr:hypothetical protein EYF80_008359 [Liparis tanakae]